MVALEPCRLYFTDPYHSRIAPNPFTQQLFTYSSSPPHRLEVYRLDNMTTSCVLLLSYCPHRDWTKKLSIFIFKVCTILKAQALKSSEGTQDHSFNVVPTFFPLFLWFFCSNKHWANYQVQRKIRVFTQSRRTIDASPSPHLATKTADIQASTDPKKPSKTILSLFTLLPSLPNSSAVLPLRCFLSPFQSHTKSLPKMP